MVTNHRFFFWIDPTARGLSQGTGGRPRDVFLPTSNVSSCMPPSSGFLHAAEKRLPAEFTPKGRQRLNYLKPDWPAMMSLFCEAATRCGTNQTAASAGNAHTRKFGIFCRYKMPRIGLCHLYIIDWAVFIGKYDIRLDNGYQNNCRGRGN